MAAGRVAPTEPKGVGLGNKITINKPDDPSQLFDISIFGDWTHRQVMSINYQLMKAFRLHMSQIRREGLNVENDEKENGDVD
jgi:hypothetical protein